MMWFNKTGTRGINTEFISFWEFYEDALLSVHINGRQYEFFGEEARELRQVLIENKQLLNG